MQDIGKELSGYVLSLILVICGALFTSKYLQASGLEEQPSHLLLGGLFLILVGIMVMPILAKKMGGYMTKILLGVGLLASCFLGFNLYSSVDEDIQFIEDQKEYNAKTIRSLKDIRLAQQGYKDSYGTYTDSWDTLSDFIMQPSIPVVFRIGYVDDSIEGGMNDYLEFGWVLKRSEVPGLADSLGYAENEFSQLMKDHEIEYIVVDTSYISVWEKYFIPEVREEAELPLVTLESIPFNPIHKERYLLETSTVKLGGVEVPTIVVQDPNPFPFQPPYPFGRDKMKKDTLQFGSLINAHTDGNWGR
jgi:hypothetical protein